MDHGSFSSTFLRIYCSLNIVVYSFTLCSCVTLPFVWTNLSESWGLEDVFVLMAIFSSWKKKYALAGKGTKRCFWLTWMSISKISRKYWAVMSVESFENGLFCQKQAKNDQNSTKWPFCRCSTGITAQYFLLIFHMLIQVNQKHLLAPFPASTYFFFHELKMAIRTKASSRPQLSLKLAHTKGSVAQLHNIASVLLCFTFSTCTSWKKLEKGAKKGEKAEKLQI